MPNKPMEQKQPMLGIFWLFNGHLIINTSPLNEGERFGDFLGHPPSHLRYWTSLQERGDVPFDIEYEDPPRGRVSFNSISRRFELYADRCILKKKVLIGQIMKAMCLPATLTDASTDGPWGHYKCSRCLRSVRADHPDDL